MELRCVAARQGRLFSFLKGELHMSSGLINRLKRTDAIRVDGVHRWMDFAVMPGNVITVALEDERPQYPAQQGPVSVVFEDDFLLAVDKTAGMLIHPSHAQNEGTLANFVAGYYAATAQKSAFHPMTRLNRDTFGIVLLAKNAHVHTLLQETRVTKTYHAWVLGGPREDRGTIDAPIARLPLPSLLRHISPEGKPSLTEFRVLERRGEYSKLALTPVTGRTPQLRLHCLHRGFPILGDPQYCTEESRAVSEQLGLSHQLLCAKQLELTHPMTGQPLLLESRLDADLL